LAFEILKDIRFDFSLNEDAFILMSIDDSEFKGKILSYNKGLNSMTNYRKYSEWIIKQEGLMSIMSHMAMNNKYKICKYN